MEGKDWFTVCERQRYRISKVELCLYADFLYEGYQRLVGESVSFTSVVLMHAFSLLCRALSLEYFHTKRQRYSVSAACLMLALNAMFDEQHISYSDIIASASVLTYTMNVKYLVVIWIFTDLFIMCRKQNAKFSKF